jgi:hypothetical protein
MNTRNIKPVLMFRKWNPDRTCSTCRFFLWLLFGEVWRCKRPGGGDTIDAKHPPYGCVCDGWYKKRNG